MAVLTEFEEYTTPGDVPDILDEVEATLKVSEEIHEASLQLGSLKIQYRDTKGMVETLDKSLLAAVDHYNEFDVCSECGAELEKLEV